MNTIKLLDEDIIEALRKRGIFITPMELGEMDTEKKWRVLGIEATDFEGKLRFVNEAELNKRENDMTKELNKHEL